MKGHVIALDQGTTSSRAIIFNEKGEIVSLAQRPFPQIYPRPGWVEHDPMDILSSQFGALAEAFEKSGLERGDIAAIGVTNQRETAIVWDRATGRPVYNAIVWQCRRTAPICDRLASEGLGAYVRDKTGLLIDAYFSGTKIKWILDNVPGARSRAEKGELLFGNVDSWLIWNLTGGREHISDFSNCSRTMLFDIDRLRWDSELCRALDVPVLMLPAPVPSSAEYGRVAPGIKGLEAWRWGRGGACPSAAAPATRPPPCWARAACSRGRARTPTARAASRWSTPAGAASAACPACSPAWPGA